MTETLTVNKDVPCPGKWQETDKYIYKLWLTSQGENYKDQIISSFASNLGAKVLNQSANTITFLVDRQLLMRELPSVIPNVKEFSRWEKLDPPTGKKICLSPEIADQISFQRPTISKERPTGKAVVTTGQFNWVLLLGLGVLAYYFLQGDL